MYGRSVIIRKVILVIKGKTCENHEIFKLGTEKVILAIGAQKEISNFI